jgi:hypothetical protein
MFKFCTSFSIITCAMQVRVSKDDLEKERGAVMEEYRGNRNATGRMQDAHWVLMMEGSKVLLLTTQILHDKVMNQFILRCVQGVSQSDGNHAS